MVRTFQLAKRGAGGFVFFFVCLPGAWFYGLLVERGTLSSRHPLEQADRGGSAPYWPGAAQLEAGDS